MEKSKLLKRLPRRPHLHQIPLKQEDRMGQLQDKGERLRNRKISAAVVNIFRKFGSLPIKNNLAYAAGLFLDDKLILQFLIEF